MQPRIRAISGPAVGIVALVVTVLVGTVTAAVAAQDRHRDARGDVLLLDEDGSTTLQPSRQRGDITRVRVVHGAYKVRVRVGFRDLAMRSSHLFFLPVRTPHHRFEVDGFTGREEPQGHWSVLDLHSGEIRRCTGLRHRVDYADERVRVLIPRRCLARPPRVRAGAAAETMVPVKERTYLDDAYSSGQVEHARLGPWLRRG